MANKTLFSNSVTMKAPKADIKNAAGGKAYSTSAEYQLAQYVVTGTFNGTYYARADQHLERMKELTNQVSPEFLAKVAVYGHQTAKMKDLPAFCLAVLASKGKLDLLRAAWPKVITNVKMLLNFVQIVRSGQTGRKSFGSAVKRLIQEWITSRDGKQLMLANVGHSSPSLGDVIKMTHPIPRDSEQDHMFAYIIGRDYDLVNLPEIVQSFEAFKKDNTNALPDIPFRALTNCVLTVDHWKQIAVNMPWNTLRMNLNMLQRKGVFEDSALTKQLANKIADPDEVKQWNAFPYQLFTAYKNMGPEMPVEITNALQDALDTAVTKAPNLGRVCICPDLSGSMNCPITGNRGTVSSKTSRKDVAALMAAIALRQNPEADVVAWATHSQVVKLNPRDSVMTNAHALRNVSVGHGTDASQALRLINQKGIKCDAIVYLSDFQSWMAPVFQNSKGTGLASEWELFRKRNKGAKFIGIDLGGDDGSVQLPDNPDALNIAGFSDSVFDVIGRFVRSDNAHFVDTVNEVEL